MTADRTLLLNYDLHKQDRTSTLSTLWKNNEFLDVTIACDDDQIDAHKVILSSASPFFHSILNRNQHNHPLLYLRGTKKKDVESLLEFIYSGQTEVLQEELEDFMTLANSLKVKGLIDEEDDVKDIEMANKRERGEKRTSNPKKKTKSKNKSKVKVDSLKDEVSVELSEDVSIMDDGVSIIADNMDDDVSIIVGDMDDDLSIVSEPNNSLENNDEQNTSLTEYNETVLSLTQQSEDGFSCAACPYTVKSKSHMKEHVEQHIEGYSHACRYCDKTFPRKRTWRHHERRCRC